ncbi:hypothetical protein B0H16DRAFT_1881073 [Mycena metata]|uniref:Uncharacterized protein n=1 Tax=Mycena metata TaxID=1033252 RepID=A0AAD7IB55_9AGAR|nr:hypothetical protein B0H16DRAFT_1694583 [Mycena metata]KAJ7772481.1 hypothetical protein B0H16DRAFT_1881073 [Mycena metata]
MFAFRHLALISLAVSLPALEVLGLAAPSTVDLSQVKPAVDIKIAAATAAYAVRATSAAVDDYVDLFNAQSLHVGRYPAEDFIAAVSAAPPHNCDVLSVAQLQALRGWPTLLAQVEATMRADVDDCKGKPYDTGDTRPMWTTNEGGITIAYSCAGPGPYDLLGGQPICTTEQLVVQGSSHDASGALTATYSAGTASSLTLTTSSTSSMSIGVTVSVGVNIKVFEASASTTYTESVTNEKSNSAQHTLSVQSQVSVGLDPTTPNTYCSLKFNTTSCTSTGVVRVPFVATGWLATKSAKNDYASFLCSPFTPFAQYCLCSYNDQIVYFNIDATLPDDKLRSSVMELQGAVKGNIAGNYTRFCTNLKREEFGSEIQAAS